LQYSQAKTFESSSRKNLEDPISEQEESVIKQKQFNIMDNIFTEVTILNFFPFKIWPSHACHMQKISFLIAVIHRPWQTLLKLGPISSRMIRPNYLAVRASSMEQNLTKHIA